MRRDVEYQERHLQRYKDENTKLINECDYLRVRAENLEVAQEVFLNQFNEYAEKELPAALVSLMPDPEFLDKVDEKITLEHVPNWLYVEKLP